MGEETTAFDRLVEELAAWIETVTAIQTISPQMVKSEKWCRWECRLDFKTCIQCFDKNGAVYEKDNDFWETGKENPPLHPNCRCVLEALDAIMAGTATLLGQNGADYALYYTGLLPEYYITKEQAIESGWISKKGNLADVLPGMQMGGTIYQNNSGKLPDAPGRIWYEADINYERGFRNGQRILYSSDGLIFVSYDHYHSFYEITGGSKW